MNKELKDLPDDIFSLFDPDVDHVCDDGFLDEFTSSLKEILRLRLGKYTPPENPIRFSALGKPDRQIWYDAHPEPALEEGLKGPTYIKFLYGDLIEAMILYLAKEAGHKVELQQHEIEVDGAKGHIDAIIDGVLVDVKSASPYGYKKFSDNTVEQDDPFGYVAQLSGYGNVLTPGKDAAWVANDKVSGDICVSILPALTIAHYKPEERIAQLKEVIKRETPPELCYQPVPDGSSGNFKLPTPCSYCKYKHRCHPNLRVFIYSTGPRFLTTVKREPNVPEAER